MGCGAEPINASTMRAFIDAFAPAKMPPEAVMPAYGMAEATLAIAFDRLDRPFTSVHINRERYEQEKLVELSHDLGAMELVSCGSTFQGHEVGILGDDGVLVPDGNVGEVVVRGPSVSPGYFQNPEASSVLLRNGWLHTGDLGFKLDGQLYISGRMKDLIILNGRNYYPQSIEWEIEQVSGVRRGNVVAFSVPGEQSEELVVVVETRDAAREELSKEIRQRVHDSFGLRARDIVLLAPGSLPKTSSGKLQRRRTRTMYQESTLGAQGSRLAGSTATRLKLARHLNGVRARALEPHRETAGEDSRARPHQLGLKQENDMSHTDEEILTIFKQSVKEVDQKISVDNVNQDTDLGAIGLDSVTQMEVIGIMEERLDIRFPDEDLATMKSLRDLTTIVRRLAA
ncbi:MAG: AMP-binding protein [Myxococcales bacterium]|nr:AMP-binding protein [Myxococcales bacterium]